jgi:hypothetical protein
MPALSTVSVTPIVCANITPGAGNKFEHSQVRANSAKLVESKFSFCKFDTHLNNLKS